MLSIFDDYAEDLSSLLELDGEMAQFQYLIDIGRKSTEFEEDDRIRQHEMDGCMATVWIIQTQKDECYYYQGDSNAAIVKGLVTIITQALSGHTQKELKEVDIQYTKCSFVTNGWLIMQTELLHYGTDQQAEVRQEQLTMLNN